MLAKKFASTIGCDEASKVLELFMKVESERNRLWGVNSLIKTNMMVVFLGLAILQVEYFALSFVLWAYWMYSKFEYRMYEFKKNL